MRHPARAVTWFALIWGVVLALMSCAPLPPAEKDARHPLAGRIWSLERQDFVTPAALLDDLAAARFVLLGEAHDNSHHHELQAWAVAALAERSRRLALVAEMIAADQEPGLALFHAEPRVKAATLATFVNWAGSGWPDFAQYEPIFDAAVRAGFPIVAGNLDRGVIPAMHRTGLAALPDTDRQRLDLEKGVPDRVAGALGRSIADAHCGIFAPDKSAADKLANFVAIQYARDAAMARALIDHQGDHGAILIAGGEHVRRSTGVPFHLVRMKARGRALSVLFAEVDPARLDPRLYAADVDYLWFTGGPDRGDPCAAFKR